MSERRKERMANYLKIYDEAFHAHTKGTNYTNLNQSHEFALKVMELEKDKTSIKITK